MPDRCEPPATLYLLIERWRRQAAAMERTCPVSAAERALCAAALEAWLVEYYRANPTPMPLDCGSVAA